MNCNHTLDNIECAECGDADIYKKYQAVVDAVRKYLEPRDDGLTTSSSILENALKELNE